MGSPEVSPSRPDAFGEPRPPAAPRTDLEYRRYRTVALHLDPHRPPRRYRIGPPGHPPLEAVVVPRRARLAEAGWQTIGLGLVYLVVLLLALWWYDLTVADVLWIVVGMSALTFIWRYGVSDVPEPVVAGSDWVGTAHGRRSRVVPLYELTRIDVALAIDLDGDRIPGSTALVLDATDPRRGLTVDLALLQANPALWDLVHRGITASMAAGAALTPDARAALRGA